MAQIIVDPRDQREFARALNDLVLEMRQREAEFADLFNVLQKTWQDDHAKRFADAQLEMSLYLAAFYGRSGQYVEYLNAKAKAAEGYLGLG